MEEKALEHGHEQQWLSFRAWANSTKCHEIGESSCLKINMGHIFHKKSLNMGPIFYKNVPKHGSFSKIYKLFGEHPKIDKNGPIFLEKSWKMGTLKTWAAHPWPNQIWVPPGQIPYLLWKSNKEIKCMGQILHLL